MGAIKALRDPFTADDKKPSRRIPIFVYCSTPREHIIIFGGRKIVSAQLSSRVTRLCWGSFNIEDKEKVFNCDILSLNLIQDYGSYKKFEGVWGKLHRMKAQSKQKLED